MMNNFDPEAPDLKGEWVRTRDIRFAAIAIGRWPSDPPVWAVLACYAEATKHERKTQRGYSKVKDGEVLDEVIRVYFYHEDQARRDNPNFKPSEYSPPDQRAVIAEALLNTQGLDCRNDGKVEQLRARTIAIERRLMEEEEAEGFPKRASDGARETQRYFNVLREWGDEHYGGPPQMHQLALYISMLIDDGRVL